MAGQRSGYDTGLVSVLITFRFCNMALILRSTDADNSRRYQLEWCSISFLTVASQLSVTIVLAETTFLTSSFRTSPTGKGCTCHPVSCFHKNRGSFIQRCCWRREAPDNRLEASSAGLLLVSMYLHWVGVVKSLISCTRFATNTWNLFCSFPM